MWQVEPYIPQGPAVELPVSKFSKELEFSTQQLREPPGRAMALRTDINSFFSGSISALPAELSRPPQIFRGHVMLVTVARSLPHVAYRFRSFCIC